MEISLCKIPFAPPSANILEEAEADGPMKSTQNQDHRSHTTKYVKQIFMKIFGPKTHLWLRNWERWHLLNKLNKFVPEIFGPETIGCGDDDAAFGM